MTRVHILVAALLVLLVPRGAHAQLDTFVQATRALAIAATSPEEGRGAAVRKAVQPMATALAEWDRRINALESRVDREQQQATPQRQFQLHVELGASYGARGRFKDALREFDLAAGVQSSSDLQLLRALTLESAGRSDDAARAFRAAWTLDPGNAPKAYYALQRDGLTSQAERDRARAVLTNTYPALATATDKPATPPFFTLGAVSDTLLGTPAVGDAHTASAFELLTAGKYSDAVGALTRGDQPGAEGGRTPVAHFIAAQAHEAANRVPEARREYTAALRGTLAGRRLIYVAIGRLAQVEGDSTGAVAAYREAVRLSPNDPTLHLELAGAYLSSERADDALAELIAGLLVDPTNATLHAAIGQLHLDAGRPSAAVPAFTRALELNPSRYEVRYALAAALTRLGRTDDASQQLELFERVRREQLEKRRRDIQQDVEKEETIRRGLATAGSAP